MFTAGSNDCPGGSGGTGLVERGTVLAAVKDASRRLRRSPAAILDRSCARCHRTLRPGRRNGPFQPNEETGIGVYAGSADFHPCFSVRLSAVSPSRPESVEASCGAAVKDGRRPPPQAARSVLDGREHGARLEQVGGRGRVGRRPVVGDHARETAQRLKRSGLLQSAAVIDFLSKAGRLPPADGERGMAATSAGPPLCRIAVSTSCGVLGSGRETGYGRGQAAQI